MYRWLVLFFVYAMISETVSSIFHELNWNNWALLHVYDLISVSLFVPILVKWGHMSAKLKWLAYTGTCAFVLWYFNFLVVQQNWLKVQTVQWLFIAPWMCFWSLMFMRKLLQADDVNFRSFEFLWAFGVLFYHSAAYFNEVMDEMLITRNLLSPQYRIFQPVVNIVTNGIFCYAFICLKKNSLRMSPLVAA